MNFQIISWAVQFHQLPIDYLTFSNHNCRWIKSFPQIYCIWIISNSAILLQMYLNTFWFQTYHHHLNLSSVIIFLGLLLSCLISFPWKLIIFISSHNTVIFLITCHHLTSSVITSYYMSSHVLLCHHLYRFNFVLFQSSVIIRPNLSSHVIIRFNWSSPIIIYLSRFASIFINIIQRSFNFTFTTE